MSLLNDALRKKQSEHQQTDSPLTASLPKLGARATPFKRNYMQLAIGAVVVLVLVMGGIWLYASTSHTELATDSNAPNNPGETQPTESVVQKPVNSQVHGTSAGAMPPGPAPTVVANSAKSNLSVAIPKLDPAPQSRLVKPPPEKSQTPTQTRAAQPPKKPKAVSKVKPAARKKPANKVKRTPTTRPDRAQRQLQSDRLYQKARQYHRRGKLEQAIALYQEVIKIDPEHGNGRFNLGAAYLQTESFNKAYAIMADLYLKEPNNQQVMLNLAIANIGRRRFDEALVLLDKAADHPEPPQFEIALHKGIAFNHLNQTQEAMAWYKRAEALRPEDPRLLFNLAVVADQQQRYAAAIGYYRKHLDKNPDMTAAKEKQIRRRIRTLQAYHTQPDPKE